jgi:hypothetical protein
MARDLAEGLMRGLESGGAFVASNGEGLKEVGLGKRDELGEGLDRRGAGFGSGGGI